ncbi:MAG: ABC transporter ATP-binding protein [Ruminococcaceae bacterium]|nr:ABC transporter ATP-binding protein [Oscillospiraceae bacterium]
MLELERVTKKYGEKCALNGVSMTLSEGIYGLLGPNGAGKSTMMNIITGNLRPTAGNVSWNGGDIYKLGREYRAVLGYAPQHQGLYDAFSGRRFLCYMAALKNIPRRVMKSEIERVLSYVNLTEAARKPIGAYSGGMKQRILIAQAILGDPKIVVLDEPTAGLDPKERVRIREKIKDISGDKIILVSTHVVSDIQSIAKEIILLKNGEILDRNTVPNLCTKYGSVGDLEQVYMHLFGEDERR